MKTFISFKTLMATLAMALSFVATADIVSGEVKLELTQVRSINAETSELSFNRSFINENGVRIKQSLKVTDDDGMLSIAALNFAMTNTLSEVLFQKGHGESYREWELQKDRSIVLYKTARPALLSALNKLAVHSSKAKKELEIAVDLAVRRGDRLLAQDLYNKLLLAKAENESALKAHADILALEQKITPEQLNGIVGKLISEHGENHFYSASIDGAKAIPYPLLDRDVNNPIGGFFASRPIRYMYDISRMNALRGDLELAPNVLQEIETASRLEPASTHTQRAPSLDGVLE